MVGYESLTCSAFPGIDDLASVTVHRPVDDPRCDHARTAQAGKEGGGFPVSVRRAGRNRSLRGALP